MRDVVRKALKRQRRIQTWNMNLSKSDQRRGMVSRFGLHQRVTVGDSTFAALVGVSCGSALAFEAAIHGLLTGCSSSKAVERPHEQDHYYHADRDVNTPTHSLQG
jgi:hypothetical protein